MVERLVFLGSSTQVIVRIAPGAVLQALIQNDGGTVPYSQGTPIKVHLPPDALRVLPESDHETPTDTPSGNGAAPGFNERTTP
jgi:hypothetical protein